jgi:hypothetical protein
MGEIRGDISVMALSDLLIWAGNRKMSGVLEVEKTPVRKIIVVHEGAVIRTGSSCNREALGQFLVNFGLVTEDQLQRAITAQAQETAQLGQILVDHKLLQPEQVVQTLEYAIRETVLDAARWNSGSFTFKSTKTPGPNSSAIPVSVPLLDLHRESVKRAKLWATFAETFTQPYAVFQIDDTRLPPDVHEDTLEGRIISCIRRGMGIDAITLELHSPDFPIYALLHSYISRGLVRMIDPDNPPMDVPIEIEWEVPTDLPSAFATPRLVQTIEAIRAGRRLTARERYILGRIDGIRSIHAIVQVSPMSQGDALTVFKQLVDDGFIALS